MNRHFILSTASIRDALMQLNTLGLEALNLFVIDANGYILGSISDGDIRRYLIQSDSLNESVRIVMNTQFERLIAGQFTLSDLDRIRSKNIKLIPIIDESRRFIKMIDLNFQTSFLPVDALIMAGGEGQRLRPLTENVPKPMLTIGSKPIIEHNIDRFASYGINNIYISLRYLGHKISDYFEDGASKNLNIKYVWETEPLGTLGALAEITEFEHDTILVMNSDLLTTIDFEDFYRSYIDQEADLAIATVPYKVQVPYAVLQTNEERVLSLEEKPTFTYYSNAGIYLFRREFVKQIPCKKAYNATDFIEALIRQGKKVISYPILGYWLDIGKWDDYAKAQEDIKHIKL